MSTPSPALGNRTPEQLKVAELREELKKRGIQIKGLKKDLVDRLEEVLKQEELEQQKNLESVVEDAAATPVEQAEPVTPVTKRRSKVHDHHAKEEEQPKVDSEPVLASEGTEVTISVTEAAAEDVVLSTPVEEIAAGNGGKAPVDEQTTTTSTAPALEDLVADLEQNFRSVVQEEVPQAAAAEETKDLLKVEPADIVPAADANVAVAEEVISTTLEKTVTTTVEEEVVPVVPEEQNVATVEEQQTVTTSTRVEILEESANEVATLEETTVTVVTVETSTTVADGEAVKPDTETVGVLEGKPDEVMEEAPKEDVTEDVTATAAVPEADAVPEAAAVPEADAVPEAAAVPETPAVTDVATVPEAADVPEAAAVPEAAVVTEAAAVPEAAASTEVAEAPKDESVMDVDGGAEKGSNVEDSKGETPMDVDADTQKGFKRKDAAGDGELTPLEPTKRRRWNSGKGEEDSKSSVKDVQPLEVQESAPSVPSAKVLTPKSAPPEKVAVTRTAPTRTEATVNGEGHKTRTVPPSAKPATTSLKIDKFLRPFTFKAVKELLAQTGAVQDVWMDQIKTHCYVTYSSVEEATATRNALYNLQWPPQGGRLLTAEFVDPSEVKTRTDAEKAAAAAGPTAAAAPSTNAITPRGGLAANSKASKEGNIVPSSGQPSAPAAGALPPPPPLPFSPRDRLKQEVEKTPTLDDLFRKTRSKPHIYYLPLTAQEVADKAAARNREAAATKPGVKA
jgi:apoptotic chromatin condensation inducer in the nucleus